MRIIEDLKNKINATLNKKSTKSKQKESAKFKKMAKISVIVIALILILIIGFIVITKTVIPEIKYGKANNLMQEGKYNEAVAIFNEISEYKDSEDKIFKCNSKIRESVTNVYKISNGSTSIARRMSLGIVILLKNLEIKSCPFCDNLFFISIWNL